MKNLRIRELRYNLILTLISSILIVLNFILTQSFHCERCWYSLANVIAIYLYPGLATFLSLYFASKYVSIKNMSYLHSLAYPLRTFMLITIFNIMVSLTCSTWLYPNLKSDLKTQYIAMVEKNTISESEKKEKIGQFNLRFIVSFALQILFSNTIIAIPSSLLSVLILKGKNL